MSESKTTQAHKNFKNYVPMWLKKRYIKRATVNLDTATATDGP